MLVLVQRSRFEFYSGPEQVQQQNAAFFHEHEQLKTSKYSSHLLPLAVHLALISTSFWPSRLDHIGLCISFKMTSTWRLCCLVELSTCFFTLRFLYCLRLLLILIFMSPSLCFSTQDPSRSIKVSGYKSTSTCL